MSTERVTSSTSAAAGRFAGLDGLRALMVLLVVLDHQHVIAFGWVGVEALFVLSGFLITGLLWKAREQMLRPYLVRFYGRRVLRISPLYYAFLLLCAVLSAGGHLGGGVRPALPWLASYTYNFWLASRWFTPSFSIGHLWSISVEEQFYLIWPLVVFACSRRSLRRVLIGVVLLGPVIRLAEVWLLTRPWFPANPDTAQAMYVLAPTHFDALAAGGFMALFPLGGARKLLFGLLVSTAFAVVLALAVSPTLRDHGGYGPGGVLIWGFSLLNVTAAVCIDCLTARKLCPWLFDWRPLRYLGTISYGLYVFHVPVQWAVNRRFDGASVWLRLGLELALTVVVAAASFHGFERPFLTLKQRFFPEASAPAA